jgi:hypothetical protein
MKRLGYLAYLCALLIGLPIAAEIFVTPLVAPALAQIQTQPVFTPKSNFAVLSSAARVPGTYNSNDFTVGYGRGLICIFNQTANTPTPSTTIAIQGKDPISGTYYTLGTGAAVTTTNGTAGVAQNGVIVYPGFTGTAPTGFTAVSGFVPLTARVQMVVGGTGSSTGTVNCSAVP